MILKDFSVLFILVPFFSGPFGSVFLVCWKETFPRFFLVINNYFWLIKLCEKNLLRWKNVGSVYLMCISFFLCTYFSHHTINIFMILKCYFTQLYCKKNPFWWSFYVLLLSRNTARTPFCNHITMMEYFLWFLIPFKNTNGR